MFDIIINMMPNDGEDGKVDEWMKRAKDVSNWECVVKNGALREKSTFSGSNVEDE